MAYDSLELLVPDEIRNKARYVRSKGGLTSSRGADEEKGTTREFG